MAGDCIRFSLSQPKCLPTICASLTMPSTPQSRLPVAPLQKCRPRLTRNSTRSASAGWIRGTTRTSTDRVVRRCRPVIVGLVRLAQQAFQRDFHHHLVVAGGCDQQAFVHYPIDQWPAVVGQVGPVSPPAHRGVSVGVEGGQPRNERRAQQLELVLPLGGVSGQDGVALGVHHPGAAHPFGVIGEAQRARGSVVLVGPFASSATHIPGIGPIADWGTGLV